MPALRIKLLNSGEERYALKGERITIGREPDNTIQINDRSVSGHHAELIEFKGHYRLHDLQSTNLSFVDGEPVTDYHLRAACKIAFGTVQCEFDPAEPDSAEPELSAAELERDVAFLRAENGELRSRVDWLQRRIDMLGSARLVTGRTDNTPHAIAEDALKPVAAERDHLRHQISGLQQELSKAREELALTIRERDAARQAMEILQAEKIVSSEQLKKAEKKKETQRIDTAPTGRTQPPPPPLSGPAAPKTSGLPSELEPVAAQLLKLRAAVDRLVAAPADLAVRADAADQAALLLRPSALAPTHAFSRLVQSVNLLLEEARSPAKPLQPTTLRTIRQATDFLSKLLEPRLLEAAKSLPPPHVLAIDDDADLLSSVVELLRIGKIETTGFGSAEEALAAVETQRFDLVLVDVGLPGMDGTRFCARTRELPTYRRTPIVFLTGTDTLDKRAETSLSGGSDFIGKPFNGLELPLKVQTWVFKHQLGQL
ncbi:MAG: twitching motility two-component system response regulator PilG [Chthoniobacter sp.]|jgi:CheY-like chemotaxis protein|nr:twitching motility two-component system response regulator PilG [Chthoniobacter sp.]